jgi:sterol desaturase/sphingolipid hydroxylase (fatty acid hydroxylase superfamily)
MVVLGFADVAVHTYIPIVYVHSEFLHANVGGELGWVGALVPTPRFHHWHQGIEREAIDVNFDIHFPLIDRLFGTHPLPEGQWPQGYGIEGHPVTRACWTQLLPAANEARGVKPPHA